MSTQPLAVADAGVVSSVGLTAPSACAAIRARLTNPNATSFLDSKSNPIVGHVVPLTDPWCGSARLAQMAAMAIEECLDRWPRTQWTEIPLLLCVAERERPGRLDGLDNDLILEIQNVLKARFAAQSATIPHGRVAFAVALQQARVLIYEHNATYVLIAGTDSLLTWPTLRELERTERLLSEENSNGFIAGEAGASVLVSRPSQNSRLLIDGLGFSLEEAHIAAGQPLRAEGLTQAILLALQDAGCEMHDLDWRLTDISGEQYYFKEAALALSRTLRQRKEEFDLWHPAECVGETGAAIGPLMLAVADTACRKQYAPGSRFLLHSSNDAGQRAAVVTHFENF